ncbi:MAG: Unknown protein [uncultured Sulfurovum sp.]|uniref:Uncharacterized protein n=1 Tax=uncultured Sulfurovum sp. TaxID=269237 RepID=A0A6S6TN15_9BACT|nr:MAG: Unknown protein [uncultured Sulfurovum sp.]
MIELMLKMTSWLVAAMALGFIVAWLLSKLFYSRKYNMKEDSFSAIIFERNNMIEKLEKKFRDEKLMFERLSNDFENSQKGLAEKTSLLTTLQHKVDNTDDSINLKHENSLLQLELKKLKKVDNERLKELLSFEEVLVHSENKMEENERNYKQVLKNLDQEIEKLTLLSKTQEEKINVYQKNIADLEKELKLYEAGKADSEFIISKDQFLKIEEQLEIYQKEIVELKHKNSELKAKRTMSEVKVDEESLEKEVVDKLRKENDDSSVVKVFRETYKKITKS